MLIVDAQIHLWNAGNPTSATHRQVSSYLKDDALKEMDAGGVDAALLTPHTPWDPNANELAIEAARQHPDRFAILGNFPLDKPVILHCASGGRAALAGKLLKDMGYQKVYNLGGFKDWVEAGGKVEK